MLNPILVAQLSKQSNDQSKIVKNAWLDESYLTFTAPEIGDMCNQAPVTMTKMCLAAGDTCKDGDEKCAEAFKRYVVALGKGYKKDFEKFKKESSVLGYIGTGLSVAAGYFSNPDDSPEMKTPEEKKKHTTLVVGVSVSVLVAASIGIYFYLKNKK